MLYCDISSFQPMEICMDYEEKLTLHGLVQVCFYTQIVLFTFLKF